MARMWLGTRPARASGQPGGDAGAFPAEPARDGTPGEPDTDRPAERGTTGGAPFWRRLFSRRP